jgi:putative alpha-1,2-mannosidase
MFTSPLFSKITLQLANDKTFTITSESHNEKEVYVQSRQLNGSDDRRTWISHSDLMQGGELHLKLGSEADMRPVAEEDLPYSASTDKQSDK